MNVSDKPIGVFDSGAGGLTIVKEIMRRLPQENVIYVGDTKHCPYGNKPREQVRQRTDAIINYLRTRNVKMIVIACNTATIINQDLIQGSALPTVGVIEPTAKAAMRATRNNRVAVLGTTATIRSGVYKNILGENGIETFNVACPLFAPLIESGFEGTPKAQEVVENYLGGIKNCGADTVVAGCTHYGLLEREIKNVLGDINLIECGGPTAELVHKKLADAQKLNRSGERGALEIFCTGPVKDFEKAITWFGRSKVSPLNLDKQIEK